MEIPEKVEEKKRDYLLPVSILIAALLVSVSLVYNAGRKADPGTADISGQGETIGAPSPKNVKPVNKDDHIRGSVAAPVKIIEFSDLECPFCKSFHPTMKKIIATYGDKVAWVYRHFPIDSLHPKARKEAEAAECAAEQGGNNAFWSYVDKVFEITPSNNGLDLAELPKIAKEFGLNETEFNECLASGRFAAKIQSQLEDVENAGGRGTPYSVVIAPDGKYYTIPGALPFERLKPLFDEIVK